VGSPDWPGGPLPSMTPLTLYSRPKATLLWINVMAFVPLKLSMALQMQDSIRPPSQSKTTANETTSATLDVCYPR
jgi:hypothetical protein